MSTQHRGRLRRLLQEGTTAFGTACALPHPFAMEQVAKSGFDWVFIDMQHGLSTYRDLPELCMVLRRHGVTPLVRVPFEDTSGAQRALDAGAEGIIFPYIEDAAGAREAAIACRYPPEGIRSFGPYRAPYGADLALANADLLCLVMIESVGGLEQVDAITRTPGVDGVFVGPNDLSISLGGGPIMANLYALDGQQAEVPANFQQALNTILTTAKANGKFAGIQVGTGSAATQAAEAGFDYIGIGGDTAFIQSGGEAELSKAGKG